MPEQLKCELASRAGSFLLQPTAYLARDAARTKASSRPPYSSLSPIASISSDPTLPCRDPWTAPTCDSEVMRTDRASVGVPPPVLPADNRCRRPIDPSGHRPPAHALVSRGTRKPRQPSRLGQARELCIVAPEVQPQ